MDSKLLGLLCFLSIVTTAYGLSCIKCSNTESWGMCMKYRKFVECENWEDRCYKASVDTWYEEKPVRIFERGCASASDCESQKKGVQACKGGAGNNLPLENHCNLYCCSGDYCNNGALPAVSGIILVACALLSVLLM